MRNLGSTNTVVARHLRFQLISVCSFVVLLYAYWQIGTEQITSRWVSVANGDIITEKCLKLWPLYRHIVIDRNVQQVRCSELIQLVLSRRNNALRFDAEAARCLVSVAKKEGSAYNLPGQRIVDDLNSARVCAFLSMSYEYLLYEEVDIIVQSLLRCSHSPRMDWVLNSANCPESPSLSMEEFVRWWHENEELISYLICSTTQND